MNLDRRILCTGTAELSKARRALAAQSPYAFAKTYLGEHFKLPCCPMHKEMFALFQEATQQRGQRIAIAAPRGHAKSTCYSLDCVLWVTLFELEKYIVIVSATAQLAEQTLANIRQEIESNPLIKQDFPELLKKKVSPWRRNSIQLANGVRIAAFGMSQGIRGIKHRQNRPSLIIVDDLEDKVRVINEEQRAKTASYFHSTLLKVGTPTTNVFIIGTLLHADSLLANLVKQNDAPGWTARRYKAVITWPPRMDLWAQWERIASRAVDWNGLDGPAGAKAFYETHTKEMNDGAQVLWPEHESLLLLMQMKHAEGPASFAAEKQNEPVDPQLCIFHRENFHYWDTEHKTVEELLRAHGRSNALFVGGWDPALGKTAGDYSGIIGMVRFSRGGSWHIIDADISRRTTDEAMDYIIELHRRYKFFCFAVESNGFQETLVQTFRDKARRAGVAVNVKPVPNRGNKRERIAILEGDIKRGYIKFCSRHHLLLEQLIQFPTGIHDDGPDALQIAGQANVPRDVRWIEFPRPYP